MSAGQPRACSADAACSADTTTFADVGGNSRSSAAFLTGVGGGPNSRDSPQMGGHYAANASNARRPRGLRLSSLQNSCIREAPDRMQRRGSTRMGAAAATSPRLRTSDGSPIKRTSSDLGGSNVCPPDPVRPLTEVQRTRKFLQKEIEERRTRRDTAITPTSREQNESPQHKLFIVSARLPFIIFLNEETGAFECKKDPLDPNVADILATASPRPANAVLVGMPIVKRKSDSSVVIVNEAQQIELEAYLRSELQAIPVFPPQNRNRYAELVIFPLFHYAIPSAETGMGLNDWEGYELVNETFRDAVLDVHNSGDVVWINDYPLMLLPKLLRKERPDIHIGFYLHCAFPSQEVYRIMPQREHILRGVLSSNVIGFHNFQYTQHFLSTCVHVLGLECTSTGIEACEDAGGTYTKVITVPLGINLAPYQAILNQPETKEGIARLQASFAGKKLLVAVDLLEEKKGIPHKIMAFHKFLQKAPHWAQECVFLQIVEAIKEDPSEDGDGGERGEQQRLLQQIYEMVGEVNSKFGTIGHLPIHFLCQTFTREVLAPLFAKADVMIDTPLRDVLTQSAHLFLCSQEENDCGVLILSEFSGSAQSLRAAALTVNPWDTTAFADNIQEALEMEQQERVELHRYGKWQVCDYTLTNWATNFLEELQTAERECETERLQIPPQLDHDKLVASICKSNRRLFIFGFAGVLVTDKSVLHRRKHPKMSSMLYSSLQLIANDPSTHVVIISELERQAVANSLRGIPCWIIAEGGVCYREPGNDTWQSTVEQRDTEWLAPVKSIMEYFSARTPGSNVCVMDNSVSWIYENTQGDHAAIQSKDLLIHLWAGPLISAPAEVTVEKDSVIVRPTGAGKASQLDKMLKQICIEEGQDSPVEWLWGDTLVVCIGDFHADLFGTVEKNFGYSTAHNEAPPVLVEPLRTNGMNLEANSMSLGTGTGFHTRLTSLDMDDRPYGVHGVQKSDSFDDASLLLKKTPSEPDFQVGEVDNNWHMGRLDKEVSNSHTPTLFMCTVSRKQTRAAYHLNDTNDVAFLVAQVAHEMRQLNEQPSWERDLFGVGNPNPQDV